MLISRRVFQRSVLHHKYNKAEMLLTNLLLIHYRGTALKSRFTISFPVSLSVIVIIFRRSTFL